MSAIKFSKQTIHPNPKEVDYWIDISKNPYGNVIKYFNGQDWVDLAYTGGLPDLSSYYTKVQVNELLNKKADAVEVDKLVSDEEIANVINNISFTTSNPNSVDLVKFNFDGTKVAVTLPIASNTTAGIISSDDFKDFVKQWQLQKLYIEMYDLFADIRAKYQRKLKAGLNIHIDEETDTISAAGDLSIMWDNLLGKPDFDQLFTDVYTTIDEEEDRAKAEEERLGQRITDHVDVVRAELNLKADKKDMYTKDQVDQKVSSVYRVIGSSTFEELPTEGNTIGDVYNITNDFTLNGIEYPFGTNLVWTADGWDTLSGVFDTTELEGMVEAVDTKVDEEILRAKAAELNIQTQLDAEIKRATEVEDDIKANYLPLSGGNISGNLRFTGTNSVLPSHLYRYIYDDAGNVHEYYWDTSYKGITYANLHVRKEGNSASFTSLKFGGDGTFTWGGKPILHSKNYSSYITKSYIDELKVDADLLDGYHHTSFFKTRSLSDYDSLSVAKHSGWMLLPNDISSYTDLPFSNGHILNFSSGYEKNTAFQLVSNYAGDNMQVRSVWYNEVKPWRRLAFTDSNVASATKLATPVKLWGNDFDGSSDINDSIKTNNLSVTNQITSGELVDWYGVEWTDDQSDPPLIRIGNTSYHRSLPIQSGMKGYVISTAIAYGEQIVPLVENKWSEVKWSINKDNSVLTQYFGSAGNVFVKIPEYWYIHEYDETTGTHQLKLSQTAKAGWLHHKEAYVGAYEGYSDGTYYRSTKNVIPTVSVTRETIRGLARANGYEDEYKWNIYTYEEHKAICHLFMVEYATRNSQAAVNTELTADGFKQGGLGSGCTSGSVTIDGATKYSFIPTGVTDSLGNGSGQVAYTVTQTDADGNEIGTVTRYANRYRGIENPFGHIWKHCDDVISQYNSTTAYRTFYKCNKPEHFATNKNTKYKPVCSAPVAEGYKKTLKHTIGLDLFSYEVGGSASTYWCDYNYDNTDTSEHCLLIGGRPNDGAYAGLFYLNSINGAGISYVSIGSRLTYLPWAE